MTQQLLSSKIAIVEETPSVITVQPALTAVTGLVGLTERGPVGVATLVTSWEEYQKVFGGYTANSDAALAAYGFFYNGGSFLWVARTVHYSDNTSPSSKTSAAATGTFLTAALASTAGTVKASIVGPYVLAPADTVAASVDGGGTVTGTFNAAAGYQDSATGTFALSNGQQLTLQIDGGSTQTVTFTTSQFVSIGAATPPEVAAVINASITGASASVVSNKVRITSDRKGTGSIVNITGGSANAGELAFTTGTGGTGTGTGNVSNILAVTIAEVVSILGAAFTGSVASNDGGAPRVTSNTLGASSSVHILSSGTAQAKIGFDTATHTGNNAGALNTLRFDGKTDGAYGNAVTIVIGTASSGDAARFNVAVQKNVATVESFPNCTMDSTSSDYVVSRMSGSSGSNLVAVTDLAAATSAPNNRPVNVTATLTGGNDGLSGLVDADFIGSTVVNAAAGTGLRSLDVVADLGLLIVPGRATAAMHNAMCNYCEATRFGSVFAILDCPSAQSAAQMVTYVTSTALLKELTEFAAIYWPRITVANPNTAIFGTSPSITVYPSGYIAGAYARNDASQPDGVFEAPAGMGASGAGTGFGQLLGALGVETDEAKDETKRDLVFPQLINPIVGLPNLPIHMDGARTLKDTSNFPTIGERRGVIFIEQSLKTALVFSKHRKIKTALLNRIARGIRTFMNVRARNGALASDNPKDAYSLDVGTSLNPPSEAFARRVNARIGIATAKPAEFIILRVGQDTRALEQELALAA